MTRRARTSPKAAMSRAAASLPYPGFLGWRALQGLREVDRGPGSGCTLLRARCSTARQPLRPVSPISPHASSGDLRGAIRGRRRSSGACRRGWAGRRNAGRRFCERKHARSHRARLVADHGTAQRTPTPAASRRSAAARRPPATAASAFEPGVGGVDVAPATRRDNLSRVTESPIGISGHANLAGPRRETPRCLRPVAVPSRSRTTARAVGGTCAPATSASFAF